MNNQKSYAEEHRFGRVGRIPTPTTFAVGDINTYVILPPPGGEELVLIDTGVRTQDAWHALAAGLKEFGFQIRDLTRVILTHGHPDHLGQAVRIREEADCEVWIHRDAGATFERYENAPSDRVDRVTNCFRHWGVQEDMLGGDIGGGPAGDLMDPLTPDHFFDDGDRIEIEGFDLEVIHTPGHCPEEVVFWQPESRLMFSGDHLLPDITPVCLLDFPEEHGGERTKTLVQFFESIDKVEPFPVEIAFPSHGDIIEDHRQLIASYRLHLAKRKLQISRKFERNESLTPFEVAQRLFPKVWRDQLFLVMCEAVGHLDALEAEGCVRALEDAGQLRYELVEMPAPI